MFFRLHRRGAGSSSRGARIESLEARCLFSAAGSSAGAADLAGLADASGAPGVSVTARGAAAYESGTVTRFFYIRRGGDLSQPLSVFYTVGGKAKQGLDYNPIGDGITLKPGAYLRRIEVTPVDDGIDEPNESITLTLNARPEYAIDPARPAATIRIISSENTPLPPPVQQTLTWTTRASAKIARSEAMVASVGGKMWLFGGYTDGTATATGRVDTYDPASNTWTQVSTTMPLATTHSGCAVIGDDVYLAGGYHGGSGGSQTFASNQVWKYSTISNTWTRMSDLPDARGGGTLVAVDGQLHFIGGSDLTRQDQSSHWSLNLNIASPETATWVTRAALPTVRNHLGGVALDGKIYVVGGQQNQDAAEVPQAALERYDPTTDQWTNLASLPFGRSHIAAATVVWNGHIVTFGGETQYEVSVKNVSSYDPATNTWTELASLPGSRSSGVAALINGDVYYSGGLLTTTTWKGTLS